MHFSAIWRPKFKKHHRDSELSNNQTVKKLNLWGKMTVDKCLYKSLPWDKKLHMFDWRLFLPDKYPSRHSDETLYVA